MRLIFFLLVLLIAPFACAQIKVESCPVSVLEASDSVTVAGTYVVLPADDSPKLRPAVQMTYGGIDGFAVAIEAERIESGSKVPVPVSDIGGGRYLVFADGRAWVRLTAIDFANAKFEIEVTEIQGPEPDEPDKPDEPDTPDPPDLPDDLFDNIGRRVATWSASLANRVQYAKAYETAADNLRKSPSATIDSVNASLIADLQAITNFAEYRSQVGLKLNEDLKKRFPMAKGVMAEYFDAIAGGFRAK